MLEKIKEIYNYREMLKGLIQKTLRSRYKGSFLGFLWTFVNPLLQLAVYATIFPIILKVQLPNYAIFLFVALLPWTEFVTSINGGLNCVIENASLVKKIYFPRMILPISVAATYTIDYIYCLPILIAALLISKVPITIFILFLPVVIFVQFLFTSSFCLIISSINVRFRDLQQVVGILTLAWLYFTPILYDISFVPQAYRKILFICNPMAGIMGAYRDVMFYGKMPDLFAFSASVIASIILFFIGYFIFHKLERKFAEDL